MKTGAAYDKLIFELSSPGRVGYSLPEADVAVAGETHEVSARRATEDEVARYWPRAVAVWPGYDAYRRRVDREIRLFVLEPRDHQRGGPERRRMDAPSPPPGGGGARPAA